MHGPYVTLIAFPCYPLAATLTHLPIALHAGYVDDSTSITQAAQRQTNGEYIALVSRQSVAIHPSSVLFTRRASCVLFNELLFTSRLYMRDLTQIDPNWLPELAPQYFASAAARTGLEPSHF